jgi:CBS domain containing-hemolysin-like protein
MFFVAVISGDEFMASMVSFLVMTFATIVFGELTPKMLAKKHSLRGTLMLANIIH